MGESFLDERIFAFERLAVAEVFVCAFICVNRDDGIAFLFQFFRVVNDVIQCTDAPDLGKRIVAENRVALRGRPISQRRTKVYMCDDRLSECLRLADGLFEYGYRIRGATPGVDVEDDGADLRIICGSFDCTGIGYGSYREAGVVFGDCSDNRNDGYLRRLGFGTRTYLIRKVDCRGRKFEEGAGLSDSFAVKKRKRHREQ